MQKTARADETIRSKRSLSIVFFCTFAAVMVFFVQTPPLSAEKELSPTFGPASKLNKEKKIHLTPEEKRWLEERHVVRVRVAKTPPYHHRHPGASGICVDYIRKAAKDLGFVLEMNTEDIQWKTALKDIITARKHYDLILTMKRTPERESHIAFTEDYIFVPWVIVSRREDAVRSMDDLKNRKMAFVKGYEINSRVEKKYSDIQHLNVGSPSDALEAVATSKADGYIGDLSVVNYLIKQRGLHNLTISSGTPFGSHNQAMGIRKDWPALASILNKFFSSMGPADHLAILDKWVKLQGGEIHAPGEWIFLTKKERQWLKAHPVIKVGSDSLWAPIAFIDKDGKAKGMAIDYLRILEKRLGIRFDIIKERPWYELMEKGRPRSVDMLVSAAKTSERRKYFSFTAPYISSPVVIFSRPDMPFVGDLTGLAGKKAAVIRDDAIHEILSREHPEIQLVPVSDIHKALDMLGRDVVAYLGSPITTSYYIMEYGDSMVKVVGNTPYQHKLAMASRNDWPVFAAILQKALSSISPEERNGIYRKWISVTYQHGFDYSLLWKIAGFAVVAVGVFLFWNRRLTFEVNRQTATIKANEAFLADLLNAIPNPVYYKNKGGRFLGVNRAFEDFFGTAKEDVVGKTVFDISSLERAQAYHSRDLELIESGGRRQFESQVIDGLGKQRHVIFNHAVMTAKDGSLSGIIGSIIDFTDQKRAEADLKESEERLRIIFDNAPAIMLLLNENKEVVKINQTGIHTVGKLEAQLLGLRVGDVLDCAIAYRNPEGCGSGKACRQCAICTTLDKTFVVGRNFEKIEVGFKQRVRDGIKERTLLISTSIVSAKSSKIVLVTIDDISEIRRMEKQLLHAQKMEAIGNLAGGIAHDFNNLLFPIVGLSEMLLEDLPADSPEHDHVEEIFNAAQRAGGLVRQILTFSRRDEHNDAPIKIQSVLKEVLALCRSTIPANIALSDDIQTDCGVVMADPTRIHQVAMNLITNAYHAVEHGGGNILVQLRESVVDPHHPDLNKLEPGPYAVITVADTGCGIDSVLMGKIFEPYFTTKAQGKGTGLGLSLVYGIIKEYRGDIRVHSRPGKGAAFEVYLPLMEKTATATESSDRKGEIRNGNGRILVVDDEAAIVRLETKILERLGYRVISRTRSQAAFETFSQEPEAFDLIITDMAMPEMSGDQLAGKILSVRPDIPIILCTGFSERINAKAARSLGIKGFLMKPVVMAEMAEIIRKVMDAAG